MCEAFVYSIANHVKECLHVDTFIQMTFSMKPECLYYSAFCQNSRPVKWQKNNAWRTELDLHCHYRYHCLEYVTKGSVFVHSSAVSKEIYLFSRSTYVDCLYVLVVIDLFQKLFRQDLLVASLFRNFLLAERIMRSYDCTPVSSPKLPPTYQVTMKAND